MRITLAHNHLKEFAPRKLVILVEVILFLLGMGFSLITRVPIYFGPPNLIELLMASLVGFLVGFTSFLVAKIFSLWKDTLEWVFSSYLGNRPWWIFLLLLMLVSLGEEVFFRGFLQPLLGLIPTALVFSLFHFRTNLRALLIVPLAFLLGLIFGFAYTKTGTLIIPITIHFTLSFFTALFYQEFIVGS